MKIYHIKSAEPVSDNSGIRIPPPLIFVAFLLLGVALDRIVPIRIIRGSTVAWLGGIFMALATIIIGWSLLQFRKAKTTVRPDRPASALITMGPFRLSRNPLYLAWSMFYSGIGLLLNNAWVIVLLAPAVMVITHAVIAREERHLLEKFGEAYQRYQATVRRWV